ncbi:unnamed protein product [Mucor hiemalis]
MRTTLAFIILGSFLTIATKAATSEEEEAITLAPEAHGEGIPVSVNVIQTAQVVVFDKEQILSIASDINAQAVKTINDGKEDEVEGTIGSESEEDDSTTEAEALFQHANHLTTSWSTSGVSSYPQIIDTEFTFAPITLAPESSRSIDKFPSSTQKTAMKTSVILKKVKSGSNSMYTSVYNMSVIAISIGFIGQYFL